MLRSPAPCRAKSKRRNRSLAGVAGIWVGSGTFTADNPEQVKVGLVTTNFFDVLGVRAAHGRTFTKDEEAGGRTAMMLTDGFFHRRFAANTGLVGKGLRVAVSTNPTAAARTSQVLA